MISIRRYTARKSLAITYSCLRTHVRNAHLSYTLTFRGVLFPVGHFPPLPPLPPLPSLPSLLPLLPLLRLRPLPPPRLS